MSISYSKLFVGISLPALCTGLASLLLSISANAQTIRPTTQKELKVFDPTTGNSGNIGIRAAAGTLSYTLTMPAARPTANQILSASAVTGGNVSLTWATPVSGTVTSVGLSTGTTGTDVNLSGSPITSSGTITVNIPTASATNTGKLSSTDWSTFNNKQNAIALTITGTSGAATLVGATLNIPQYQAVLTNPVTGTGTTNYLSKFANAGTLTNSLLFDNGTNVGVGTASPSTTTRFEIRGTGTTSTTTALEVDNINGGPLLVVRDDGNVGIGTTSPRSALEIQEDNSSFFRMVRPASPPRTITDYGFEGGNGGIGLYDYTKSDYSWWVSPTGNVGIGTTSPALKLHISGTTGYPVTSGTNQIGIARFESISNSNVLDIGQGNSGAYGLWLQGTGRSDLSLTYPILLNPNGGNVGVGTLTPTAKFSVSELTGFNFGTLPSSPVIGNLWYHTDGTSWRFQIGKRHNNFFTPQMTFHTNDNVGIGTINPNAKFAVATGDINTLLDVVGGASSGDAIVRFGGNQDGSNYVSGDMKWGIGVRRPSNIFTISYNSTGIGESLDANQVLSINTLGNVGIGTTSPMFRLVVEGNNEIGDPYDGAKFATLGLIATNNAIGAGGSIEFGLKSNTTFAAIKGLGQNNGTNTIGDLAFYTRAGVNDGSMTERMRIMSDGKVSVGDTDPVGRFEVKARSTDVEVLEVENSNEISLFRVSQNGDIRAGTFSQTTPTGNRQLYVTSTGVLTTTPSDARLKTNIEVIPNALQKVMSLRGVTYNWKDGRDTTRVLGMIAQEMLKVAPELVFQNNNGYYGIHYAETTGLLVEAIKEQQKIIDQLKTEQAATGVLIRQLQLDLQAIRKLNTAPKD